MTRCAWWPIRFIWSPMRVHGRILHGRSLSTWGWQIGWDGIEQQIARPRHHCERSRAHEWRGEDVALAFAAEPYDDSDEPEEKPSPCLVCDAYEARRARLASGHVDPFYVVAIGTSRHYGGREEGGWWYDRTEILEVRKVWTVRDGLRHARDLRALYPQPRYDRHSCANHGEPEIAIRAYYGTRVFGRSVRVGPIVIAFGRQRVDRAPEVEQPPPPYRPSGGNVVGGPGWKGWPR